MKILKEIEAIEKIVLKMKEKLEKLEFKIEARYDKFNDASERWQESDKGVEFEQATEELRDRFYEFESEIDTLECALETLKELTD